MSGNSFLDSGVVLGYCFTPDKHHRKCSRHIETNNYDFYISEDVEDEYEKKKPHLTTRYSDAIFEHASELKKSGFTGQLDPIDIKTIRKDFLDSDNPAYNFLFWYYQKEAPKYIPADRLEEQLRGIARGIEQNAIQKKMKIDKIVNLWEREQEYPELEEILSEIHEEDRMICIDAHDLARYKENDTVLATANPSDFVRDGHREMIRAETEIHDVVSLAVTS